MLLLGGCAGEGQTLRCLPLIPAVTQPPGSDTDRRSRAGVRDPNGRQVVSQSRSASPGASGKSHVPGARVVPDQGRGCAQRLRAGPKCEAGLFPDVHGRGGGGPTARPGVPGAPGARTYAPGRGALTMEHGLREAGIVMMTATAAGASSHHP